MFFLLIILGICSCSVIQSVSFEEDAEFIAQDFEEPDVVPVISYDRNKTAYIRCAVKTVIVPEIIWLKDGEPLQNSFKFSIIEKTVQGDSIYEGSFSFIKYLRTLSILRISDLQLEDSGIYTCEISNGPITNRITSLKNELKVIEPELKLEFEDEHSQVNLICVEKEDTHLNFIWLKNGGRLPKDSRYQIAEHIIPDNNSIPGTDAKQGGFYTKTFTSVLTIMNTQVNDSANYTCRVYNLRTGNFLEKRFKLFVEGRSPEQSTPQLYGLVSFKCVIVAENPAKIKWLKDGKPLPSYSRYFINQKLSEPNQLLVDLGVKTSTETSYLRIIEVQWEDEGNYTCSDVNPLNSRVTLDFILSIEEEDVSNYKADLFEETPLACRFWSFYILEIIWLKDGAPLPDDERFIITTHARAIQVDDPYWMQWRTREMTSVLHIFNFTFKDVGIYTCNRMNPRLGPNFLTFNLTIKDKELL